MAVNRETDRRWRMALVVGVAVLILGILYLIVNYSGMLPGDDGVPDQPQTQQDAS